MTAEAKIRTLAKQDATLTSLFTGSNGTFRLCFPLFRTCLALTATVVLSTVCVSRRVFVAVFAMSLRPAFGGYGSSRSPWAEAAHEILFSGNRFQVRGVDAAADTTQMIKIQSIRYGPVSTLIENTMSIRHLLSSSSSNSSISVIRSASDPKPATGIRLGRYEPRNANIEGFSFRHISIISGGAA